MNKETFFFAVAIVAVALAAFALTILYLDENTEQQGEQPPQQQTSSPSFVFPETENDYVESIGLEIQKGQEPRTVRISWNQSQFSAYGLALLDWDAIEQGQEVPALSYLFSFRRDEEDIQPLTKMDVPNFIPSEYIPSQENAPLELTIGKTYMIQLAGFGSYDQEQLVSKTFTLTETCLPPNCE